MSWPASSPWVLAVGGTNLTLGADNAIASAGAWNDTAYPAPFTATAGGGGGSSTFEKRPWWQPAQSFGASGKRMVPDVSAFADVAEGDNALFGGSCCPARPGYDLATGLGSPSAQVVAASLVR